MSKVWLPEDRNNNVTLGTFGIQDGHAYVFDTFGTLRYSRAKFADLFLKSEGK